MSTNPDDSDNAVSNAIIDFVNTSKYFERDSVFEVGVAEREGYYIISIAGAYNKIYPQIRDSIGAKDDIFPTKFQIRDGKLFYWNDPDQAITQEMLDVLTRFNHIDFEWRDREYNIPLNIADGDPRVYYFPPIAINDGVEGVLYYICISNPLQYKKTGISHIRRHYRIPKLICR